MNNRYTVRHLTTLLACATIVAGCASGRETTGGIGYSDEIYNASNRAVNLQSLLANDDRPVRELLEVWLAGDIRTLRSRMEPGSLAPLSSEQRASALRTLVLLAVLNEKHPIGQWKSDAELQKTLAWAVEQDADLTKTLRDRDWSKSLWRR